MGTSVNRNAPDVRVALFDRLQPLDGFIQTRVAAVRELFLKPDRPAAVPARLGHLIIRPAAVPRESHHRRAEVGVFLHQADDVRSQRRERRFGIRRRRRRLGRRGGLRGRVRGEPRVQQRVRGDRARGDHRVASVDPREDHRVGVVDLAPVADALPRRARGNPRVGFVLVRARRR
eukprot:31226-Pelagococcus_subviridis.AAC.4